VGLVLTDGYRLRYSAHFVRGRHPDYDEQQVELARRLLMGGPEPFAKVYPECRIRP